MPYFVILLGFALFSVAAALGTLLAWIWRPLQPLFPFAWRAWLWSTVGFVAANAALLAVLWLILVMGDHAASMSLMQKAAGILGALTAVLGPFIASAVGLGAGFLLGCFLAWRAVRARMRVPAA